MPTAEHKAFTFITVSLNRQIWTDSNCCQISHSEDIEFSCCTTFSTGHMSSTIARLSILCEYVEQSVGYIQSTAVQFTHIMYKINDNPQRYNKIKKENVASSRRVDG